MRPNKKLEREQASPLKLQRVARLKTHTPNATIDGVRTKACLWRAGDSNMAIPRSFKCAYTTNFTLFGSAQLLLVQYSELAEGNEPHQVSIGDTLGVFANIDQTVRRP